VTNLNDYDCRLITTMPENGPSRQVTQVGPSYAYVDDGNDDGIGPKPSEDAASSSLRLRTGLNWHVSRTDSTHFLWDTR
jgi:hypothetical protein